MNSSNMMDYDVSGCKPGRWTHDIASARQYAKQHETFYIVEYGKTDGTCPLCDKMANTIFNDEDFYQWSFDNCIPIVQAEKNLQQYKSCKEIERLFPRITSYPYVFIFDGEGDGTKLIGKPFQIQQNARIEISNISNGYSTGIINSITCEGSSFDVFRRVVDAFLESYNNTSRSVDVEFTNLNAKMTVSTTKPKQLDKQNRVCIERLYGCYGNRSLGIRTHSFNDSSEYAYVNVEDWYVIDNASHYSLRAIDVIDVESYATVTVYKGFDGKVIESDVLSSMTLKQLAESTYHIDDADTVFIKVSIPNEVLQIEDNYQASYALKYCSDDIELTNDDMDVYDIRFSIDEERDDNSYEQAMPSVPSNGQQDDQNIDDLENETETITNFKKVKHRYNDRDMHLMQITNNIESITFVGVDRSNTIQKQMTGNVQLNDNIEILGEYCFRDSKLVTSVRCGASLQRICAHSFDGCSALSNITFDGMRNDSLSECAYELNEIEDYVFNGCTALNSIVFPPSITKPSQFSAKALTGSSLTCITFLGMFESDFLKDSSNMFGLQNDCQIIFKDFKTIQYDYSNKTFINADYSAIDSDSEQNLSVVYGVDGVEEIKVESPTIIEPNQPKEALSTMIDSIKLNLENDDMQFLDGEVQLNSVNNINVKADTIVVDYDRISRDQTLKYGILYGLWFTVEGTNNNLTYDIRGGFDVHNKAFRFGHNNNIPVIMLKLSTSCPRCTKFRLNVFLRKKFHEFVRKSPFIWVWATGDPFYFGDTNNEFYNYIPYDSVVANPNYVITYQYWNKPNGEVVRYVNQYYFSGDTSSQCQDLIADISQRFNEYDRLLHPECENEDLAPYVSRWLAS